VTFHAKRRDACEKAIVKALRDAGASVTPLDGKGVPDLLVGFRGRTLLLECKDPEQGARNSRSGGAKVANALGLRDSQWEWWTAWNGERPMIATTPQEALCSIGIHTAVPMALTCEHCNRPPGREARMVGDGVFR